MAEPGICQSCRVAGLSRAIDRICMILAAAFFLLTVGDILAGVVLRYFWSSAPVWTEELARYSLIWMVMMAAVPALRQGEHMKIDLVIERLPHRARIAGRWFGHAVFLGITGLMAWVGFGYALRMEKFTTMGLGISKTIPLMAVPAGMALLFVQYILIHLDVRSRNIQPPCSPALLSNDRPGQPGAPN